MASDAGPHGRSRERRRRALLRVLDVMYDGFANMDAKVIERPVFFLAGVELAFQPGIVVPVRLPQARFDYFGDGHSISLPPDGPSSLATRSVVSLPHFVH
jgi:hypothetical protein